MMIRDFLAVAVLTIVIPFAAQAVPQEKNLPEPEGKAVYQYITRDNPYQKWSIWPGKEKLYPGTQPHGAFLTTYVNTRALQALEKNARLPDGSIVVKENYTPDKKLAAVTVMYKKAGYNPEAGDYFWLKYGQDGRIEAEGKVADCINCHRAAKDNDLLFTNDSKEK